MVSLPRRLPDVLLSLRTPFSQLFPHAQFFRQFTPPGGEGTGTQGLRHTNTVFVLVCPGREIM